MVKLENGIRPVQVRSLPLVRLFYLGHTHQAREKSGKRAIDYARAKGGSAVADLEDAA